MPDGVPVFMYLAHHLSRTIAWQKLSTFFSNSALCKDAAMMISACLDLALLCHPVLALLTTQRPKMQAQQSKWQYFLFSFMVLLGIRYASSTPTEPQIVHGVARGVCQTVDQPNPIASLYPNNATGTLNGTILVLPIPLDFARQLIPSQYKILEHAYRHLLPWFPEGMYPAILQAVHDHGVQASGFQVPDFSVSTKFVLRTQQR